MCFWREQTQNVIIKKTKCFVILWKWSKMEQNTDLRSNLRQFKQLLLIPCSEPTISFKSVGTLSIWALFFSVIQVHYTPSSLIHNIPAPCKCCSLFREVLYCNHTTMYEGRGYMFVGSSEFYEGVIFMTKKCHVQSMCQMLLTLIVVLC